jgi:hypothetical protein
LSRQRTRQDELVSDASSTDTTLNILRNHLNTVADHSKEKFNHSWVPDAEYATTSGEFVVCLSSYFPLLRDTWVGHLVKALERDPRISKVGSSNLRRG